MKFMNSGSLHQNSSTRPCLVPRLHRLDVADLGLAATDGGRRKRFMGCSSQTLKEQPISQMQYQRLVKGWLESLGLAADDYSTHSLRKTKASAIYDATKNVEAVRQLLGHASVAATSAYLGIEQAKALDIAKNHKMF